MGNHAGAVVDLLPAGEARADNDIAIAQVAYSRQQASFPDGKRYLVVLVAEESGQPTAAAVQGFNVTVGNPLQQCHQGIDAHQRLLMTVPVDQHTPRPRPVGGRLGSLPLFYEQTGIGYPLRVPLV
jgi:hypothetical protein